MLTPGQLPELLPEELETYAWQLDLPGFSEVAQRKLKAASVLVSRVGGVGGLVALQLAAAGVGRLILASGGVLQPSDLNRQLLQTHDHIGQPRIENILRRIQALNPRISLQGHPENISDTNAEQLVGQADIVVDAAPHWCTIPSCLLVKCRYRLACICSALILCKAVLDIVDYPHFLLKRMLHKFVAIRIYLQTPS